MSYLGLPRICFAGTFQADVATINNAVPYYDNQLFEPRFTWRMNLPDINGLWNPRGTGSIRLSDIRITAALLPGGAAADDPIVDGRVADDDLRVNAKFADLDPENQMVPEIWGLRLRLLDVTGREALRADFRPAAMDDMWIRAKLPSGRGDPAATYQSVLTGVRWAPTLNSPALRALRDATADGMLSIKFTMGAVEDGIEQWPDTLTFGRLVGCIGPYASGEPYHFVAGRRLLAWPGSTLHHAPCRIDVAARTVVLDLGNSVPATGRGGPPVQTGPLRLAVLGAGDSPTVLAPIDVVPEDYERVAGIVSVPLTPAQLDAAVTGRLAVVGAGTQPPVLLAENADATILRADGFVFRLFAGAAEDSATAVLHALRHGRPLPGAEIFLKPGAHPDAVTHPDRCVTDGRGRAEVPLTGVDPGSPRANLDGVVTQLQYGFANAPDVPEGTLSVRVFAAFDPPERPTWFRDVQPILQQYANLFPAMRAVCDLGRYDDVVKHAVYIRRTLLAPRASPNHMPVTRDLSPGKRDMIVKWLDTAPKPPILEIDTVADLRAVLQTAVYLEQATIPPYLTALLSLRPGQNTEIAELIRGVVLEEMQHMVQVCNLLNAVGGRPVVGRPGLVPTYPGKLPGPVLPDLTVRLRRMSIDHVRDTFMAIEQPECPTVDGKRFRGRVFDRDSVTVERDGRIRAADAAAMAALEKWFAKAEYHPQTIGWFYNQIARAVTRLDRAGNLFTGDQARQIAWPDAPGVLIRVTDRTSALLAIFEIIEQGEGSPHDLDDDGLADPDELGHYYRFQEIVEGRQLIRAADGRWVFEGPAIPFDPAGVYPMVDDPDTYRLAAGSVARRESTLCDTFYTNLLTGLHRVVDGHPEELDDVVGLMYQLQVQARKLFDVPAGDDPSPVLGPAFQSPGVTF
ncbi:ferritin-like domain-containing protein [Mangrovihabitans endophyticus]|uniref:Iminophenyl-pyruvate dimer synthase domain-containing protein n=1 Tax=Mangrovihabitans endophyticus TaxID=1751298 RepID=A0A8J3BTG9_9ACTN|nr:ferritin-like protein [Mangrovihabitans endophyticus]GGK73047.1 hypothetical protein GCM10012284_03720 [Mangrovihabitans endophyticus]